MPTMPPIELLIAVAAAALSLALLAPFHVLVAFDLALVFIVDYWELGGVSFDPTDVILFSLGLAIVARGRFSPRRLIAEIPYLLPWLALGTFTTLSYLYSPLNAENLTDPVRIAYQVYRYCWKPLLYYPICLLVLRDLRQARHAWTAILVGGNVCAGHAVLQGYGGIVHEPPGPFGTGNELAAVLIVPFVVATAGVLFPVSRFQWLFSVASVALIARAVLFSASRGGMVSMMAAAGLLGGFTALTTTGRRRLLRLAPAAALAPLVLIAVRPDVLDRPTVQHAFTLFEGSKTANMQWRIKQRWPHFLRIAVANPVLGTGTYVDETLSKDANTPHNGYLSLAVKYGFPMLALFLFFLLQSMGNFLRSFRRASDLDERFFHLTLGAAVFGVATHNLVETTWTMSVIQKYFWMFCALGAAYVHVWKTGEDRAERKPVASGPPSLVPARLTP